MISIIIVTSTKLIKGKQRYQENEKQNKDDELYDY